MVKALFDTNILIDYLNAVPEAASELRRYEQRAISIVTWMEVLVGARPEVMADTRTFLGGLNVIALDGAVAERAVKLRRLNRIRLPDAIFWATA
jgi:predicted nucleic acid-binding protein